MQTTIHTLYCGSFAVHFSLQGNKVIIVAYKGTTPVTEKLADTLNRRTKRTPFRVEHGALLQRPFISTNRQRARGIYRWLKAKRHMQPKA